jgi:ketosteroid isomerase-like protein
MRTAFLSSLLIVIAAGLMAAGPTPARVPAPDGSIQVTDSSSVVSTVRAFHTALQEGDTASVRELLASDARVAESGGLETREEYLSHHLPGDMAYAAAVNRELGLIDVTVAGDVAWTVSTSRTTGTFRDRPVNSAGAELMVLSRDSERWRIRAIHWSSRQAR